jgi:hypothetical protein
MEVKDLDTGGERRFEFDELGLQDVASCRKNRPAEAVDFIVVFMVRNVTTISLAAASKVHNR